MSRRITPMRLWSAVGAALVVGTMSGALLVGEPVTRTPHDCEDAIMLADRRDVTQDNLHHAVRVRGDAVGREPYAEADAEVVRLVEEDDGMAAAYRKAKAECLGGAR